MGVHIRRSVFTLLAWLSFAATSATAQNTGVVQGRVTESGGGAVASALVELIADNGGRAASGLTNADGRYRINAPAGSYGVSVSAVGYGTQRQATVTVTAGSTATADVVLEPRAFELEAVVVSVGKQVEKATDAPAHVEVIGERQIETRPVTTPADHLRNLSFVDVITQGVQSTNVVVRGFNNIFSGALHTLTDNRIASVPSLRVNVLNFVQTTNEDIQRMEVVLGPGAALYGPNTTDGVLHMITKSPLDAQGTTLSIAGGERSLLNVSGRTAHMLTDNVGFKLSGQYMQAEEWEYVDPVELSERELMSTPGSAERLAQLAGIPLGEAQARIARIAQRDFDIDRYSFDGRLDMRIAGEATAVLSGGLSNAGSQIELTGLGAAQAKDWKSTYVQARLNWQRLFVQGYVNGSDAGETYLLRNGVPISDESKLYVAQIQHGINPWNRQNFTYGVDYIYTNPQTNGTINGAYEDDDETKEIGAYVQSETQLTRNLELVLAGRVDDHSALPDPIFSPRAALVFKPSEAQALRVTYNRAFSTPSSLNQFLDLGTPIPSAGAARLGYSVRVQGTGEDGFSFRGTGGDYVMRSPFTPTAAGGPTTLLPAAAAPFWGAAVQVVAQQQAAAGQPLDPALLQYLLSLQPTPQQIGSNWFNTLGESGSLSTLEVPDIDPIRESTSTTFEVGYRGTVSERVLLATDVWFSRRENLVTPLTVFTPFVSLNPQQTAAFLIERLSAIMPAAQAQATAQALAGGLAQIPLGVVSSPDMQSATGAQLLATYTNVDESVDLWGVDVSSTFLITDEWLLNGSVSFVNDNVFETDTGLPVYLNAPKTKGALALTYQGASGFNAEVRGRYTDGFPASSGVYEALDCVIDDPTAIVDPCIDSYTLLDLTAGYRLPGLSGASIQLGISNLLDEEYVSFPGVPAVGRLAQLRLRYQF